MLRKNLRPMKYALQGNQVPVYRTDENGEIRHIIVDGESVPAETGDYKIGYFPPVDFLANINNKLSEVLITTYGIDDSAKYSQILADKGALPLKEGSLVWKKTEVKYKDSEKNIIDENSADYTVVGIADDGLFADLFLLKKNVK